MTTLIANLGTAASKLNASLSNADWVSEAEIDVALEAAEREATRESPEYLAVTRRLAQQVRMYHAFERDSSFGEYRLLEFKTVPSPPVLDESAYDIFVCYKISRHATQAARLVELLTALGYGAMGLTGSPADSSIPITTRRASLSGMLIFWGRMIRISRSRLR